MHNIATSLVRFPLPRPHAFNASNKTHLQKRSLQLRLICVLICVVLHHTCYLFMLPHICISLALDLYIATSHVITSRFPSCIGTTLALSVGSDVPPKGGSKCSPPPMSLKVVLKRTRAIIPCSEVRFVFVCGSWNSQVSTIVEWHRDRSGSPIVWLFSFGSSSCLIHFFPRETDRNRN